MPIIIRKRLAIGEAHGVEHVAQARICEARHLLQHEDALHVAENTCATFVFNACAVKRCRHAFFGGTGGSCK